jgi:hypothetical protein
VKEGVQAMEHQLDLAREEGFTRGVQRAAAVAASWADNYPEDFFPPDGTSMDCQSAEWARHTTRMITKEILAILADDSRAGILEKAHE